MDPNPPCDRCGSKQGVHLVTFCQTCGVVYLCGDCDTRHRKEVEADGQV